LLKTEPIALSAEQVGILIHALGGSHDGVLGWRAYFCAEDGHKDCEQLVSLGLMIRAGKINAGRDRYYLVSDEGKDWVRRTGRSVR
jgi:hypothetical protein